MLDVERWAELRREHFVGGLSIKEFVRRHGIDRNTVRRALRSDLPSVYERASVSKLDPFKDGDPPVVDGGFATYLGWLIPWGTPVTLLGQSAEDVAMAQRELVRIGIDRPAAHATGSPEQWSSGDLSSFPTATFADLAEVRHHREVVILDVRRSDEYQALRPSRMR